MDYSTTVNLPKTDFPMKADLPKREPGWLAAWEKDKVYEQALKRRLPEKGKKQFILHDGPPYANGHLHLGHALNKILKDIIVRYKTMAGFYAPYVPGWDCHGLPIELQLMKELKVTDKHKVDREKFREQARAFAGKFVDIQREEFKRMGILGDWDHPYLTMDPKYKEAIVNAFEDLQKKGYVYRGKKPVYWCFRDETALAEAEVEYENDTGPSIYVAFPLQGKPNEYYVVWTTTPWTLPANVAIAVAPQEHYSRLESHGKIYWVARKRREHFEQVTKISGKHLQDSAGSDLQNSPAMHPWLNKKVPVLTADFVAMDTGTGFVHIAPGHGAEDFKLGQLQKPPLPVLSPVDDRGLFTDEVPEWKGQHVFKANRLIMDFLKQKGALLHEETITHSYPHCWRCHEPVIFRATEQWFLNVEHDGLRKKLQDALEKVAFVPEFGRSRITGMIQSRPDWCLSRQRLWGTEIPNSPTAAGNDGRREPDIVDVWFESGVSWAAVLEQRPELAYPADMYLEGSDQHRGWFQTSLIPSVALRSQAPFKTVLTHGFVMDGEGKPMSKSLGNVIAPQQIIEQYGADVLRLWVGASDYGRDVRVSPEIIKGQTDNYRKVRNTFRYLLGNVSDFDPQKHAVPVEKMEAIDRWMMSRLLSIIQACRKAYEAYEFHAVVRTLVDFSSSVLSGFYLDVSKDRMYCDAADSASRRSGQTAKWHAADALIKLWAPILPFTSEEAWTSWGRTGRVAQADLPADAGPAAPDLEEAFSRILDVRSAATLKLEEARKLGTIKGGLEAQVILKAPKDLLGFLKTWEKPLPAFLIVSQVRLESGPGPLSIDVKKAEGKKCARCWIYKLDVGGRPAWPDVCGRCAQVLDDLPKKVPA